MNAIVLRWFGAGRLQWTFYDREGRLVREVVEDEVPAARLGPVATVSGGYVMVDPSSGGSYRSRWSS